MSEIQTDTLKLIVYGSWTAVIMAYNYRDWKRARFDLNSQKVGLQDDEGLWTF